MKKHLFSLLLSLSLLAPALAQNAISPKITDIVFISTGTNNVAYLDAFPINTDFKLRITGTNLTTLRLVPVAPLNGNLTVVNQNVAGSTATQREMLVRFSTTGSKDLKIAHFQVVTSSGSRPLLQTQKEFVNPPRCQIYDKPNLKVVNGSIVGVYNRPATKVDCPPLGTGISQHTTAENSFCLNNVPNPTLEAPIQEKTVTVPPIKFQIKNDSYAPIFSPFTIQIKRGINVIKEIPVNRMIAQEVKTITFTRDEQRKIFVRHRDCTVCYEKLTAPFNWLDPELTIVIDATNATNSSFRGTATIPASRP